MTQSSGEQTAAPPALPSWPVQGSSLTTMVKEMSFTLLHSHTHTHTHTRIKNDEAVIYRIFILLTAGQTRTAGASFTC